VTTERVRVGEAYARLEHRSWYSWSDPAYRFMMQALERRILLLLASHGLLPLRGRRILEVGCGSGHWLGEFIKWGADPSLLAGIDLLPERLLAARRRCPTSVRLVSASADALPVRDRSADLVIQSTLFSSILDAEMRRRAAAELVRAVRPGGHILWYDFFVRRPGNSDVVAISRGEIRALFPGCPVTLGRATLAQPLCRLLASRAELSCWLLERIPFLRFHYLGLIGPIPACSGSAGDGGS
jgi:SAM-dependent methyltransferase